MRRRVILVTGSSPPEACGVGDYTWSLAAALERKGLFIELLSHRDWGVSGSARMVRRLMAEKDALIHLQYPTMGYGYSVGPQLCALSRASVVTLHEFSRAHAVRKMSLLPFTLRSPRVVMTSEFERLSLVRRIPWIAKRIEVIPIGSNIQAYAVASRVEIKRIVYHGLIMPHKGLEEFLELCRLARARGMDWEFMVIGKIPERHVAYARSLMGSATAAGVLWALDRNAEEVGELLAAGGIAYLPFPDGASERRGSLKTVLTSGMPCITRRAEMTPDDMAEAVAFADTPAAALQKAIKLAGDPAERMRMSHAALKYAGGFTWEAIAERHLRMYGELR